MFYCNPGHSDMETDVFIAGSGPIGALYAKRCVDAGLKVIMVELGAADSLTSRPKVNSNIPTTHKRTVQFAPGNVMVPGYHKKNEIDFQKDIDRFVNVIKAALSTVSVPTSNTAVPTLDPASFSNSQNKPFLNLSKNPAQNPFINLGAEAVTRGVGGMTTHWTCATPRFNPYVELPVLDSNPETNKLVWSKLYDEAEKIIGTSSKEFDYSIRHNLVLRTLQEKYEGTGRVFKPLPLACHRLSDPQYVEWHSAEQIFETLFTDESKAKLFTLMTNHRCTRVVMNSNTPNKYKVEAAEVKCLLPKEEGRGEQEGTFFIRAKSYVIACGSVATAQVLANSQRPKHGPLKANDDTNAVIETPLTPNLGKYITEQPMTFCQIVLDASLINSVPKDPYHLKWWAEEVRQHEAKFPHDPISIPFHDPDPQVTTPFTKEHPWHTQIHRDAFSYGAVAENIDTRLIVDYRFFGYVEPREMNRVVFQKFYEDVYGMPQATFEFQMSQDDQDRSRRMMADMCDCALKLGGYLPGSEPQFMTPGLALHLAGTVRAGLSREDHVADTNCKVWDFDNLYVGGNGVIPTGFGANPTLTSLCYAIRGSADIVKRLTGKHVA
jgi:pyranose oxidase